MQELAIFVKKTFASKKCGDHDHKTGKYRGAT